MDLNWLTVISDNYRPILKTLGVIVFISTIVYYTYLLMGMRKLRKKLQQVQNQQETVESRIIVVNDWFNQKAAIMDPKKKFKQCWDRFFREYQDAENDYIPDIFESFKEDRIVYKFGLRKLVETIPAIFVSLGILGTFLGIMLSVSDINTTAGVDELQKGVGTLLEGMKFAFGSSIIGILFSLVYQILDRTVFYRKLSKSYDNLMLEMDRTFPVKTEGSLLEDMVQIQEKQFNDLKTFFSNEFITELTSGISETVTESLSPHLEKSNKIMENVAQSTMDAQTDELNKMVDYFVNSLNQMTGDHMKNLSNALTKTIEWQEKVHSEMSSLVDELTNAAAIQSEMARNTTDLSSQMNTYMHSLSDYHDKLETSAQEMSHITEQNTNLLGEMESLSEEMNRQYQESENQFANRLEQMNQVVDRITQLGTTMNDLQQKTEDNVESLTEVTTSMKQQAEQNTQLADALKTQHELSNQWSEKTQSLLEDLVQNFEMTESMQQNMDSLYSQLAEERQTIETMRQEHNTIVQKSVQELKQYWNDNKELLSANRDQFETLNNTLSQSMDNFADHMQRGVQSTFEQFDKELKNAVQYLEHGVGGINEVVESMEQDLDRVNKQISRFNQYLEQFSYVEQGDH